MTKIDYLKIGLLAQVAMFVWARGIEVVQSRHNYGESAILGSLFPEFLFAILAIINLLAMAGYFSLVFRKKAAWDRFLVLLAILNLVLTIFYIPLTQWAIG